MDRLAFKNKYGITLSEDIYPKTASRIVNLNRKDLMIYCITPTGMELKELHTEEDDVIITHLSKYPLLSTIDSYGIGLSTNIKHLFKFYIEDLTIHSDDEVLVLSTRNAYPSKLKIIPEESMKDILEFLSDLRQCFDIGSDTL